MALVYIFTNIQNGKQYVGKTEKDFESRLSRHIAAAKSGVDNSVFHKAISKYGMDNFRVYMRYFPDEIINEAETHTIAELNSKVPNGYNLTDGGEGMCGYTHSERVLNKISKSLKGRKAWNKGRTTGPLSEEHKKKISKKLKGRKVSKETRKKMSDANKGQQSWLGKKHTEKTKEKMRQSYRRRMKNG